MQQVNNLDLQFIKILNKAKTGLFLSKEDLAFLERHIDYKNEQGKNFTHYFSEHGCISTISLIPSYLKKQMAVQDSKGNTPLHLASEKGKLEFIEFFLMCGPIDIFLITNQEGKQPMELLTEYLYKFVLGFDSPEAGIKMLARNDIQELASLCSSISSENAAFYHDFQKLENEILRQICELDASEKPIVQQSDSGRITIRYAPLSFMQGRKVGVLSSGRINTIDPTKDGDLSYTLEKNNLEAFLVNINDIFKLVDVDILKSYFERFCDLRKNLHWQREARHIIAMMSSDVQLQENLKGCFQSVMKALNKAILEYLPSTDESQNNNSTSLNKRRY